jgi:hypothetical protein
MLRSLSAVVALFALSAQTPAPPHWCTRIPLPFEQGASCDPVVVRAPGGTMRLAVATNEAQRERGLMNVQYVPPNQGMIFVFPDGDTVRGFWMKDTITPLDMVFVRSDGTITSVAARVPATKPNTPDDKVARRSGLGHYVIELGSGQAGALQLLPGSRIVIPPIPGQ